jgi:hypothetical protein
MYTKSYKTILYISVIVFGCLTSVACGKQCTCKYYNNGNVVNPESILMPETFEKPDGVKCSDYNNTIYATDEDGNDRGTIKVRCRLG